MAGRPPTRPNILRHRIPLLSRPPPPKRRSFSSASASSASLRTAGYTLLVALSAGLFTAYYFDTRSAVHRYVFTPILRYLFDAETGHKLAVKALRSSRIRRTKCRPQHHGHPRCNTSRSDDDPNAPRQDTGQGGPTGHQGEPGDVEGNRDRRNERNGDEIDVSDGWRSKRRMQRLDTS